MAPGNKKGLSLEEKRTKMMEIFYESKDVYLLKDMEKEAPKKKGDKVFSPEVPPWCRFHQHSTMVHASPAWYHQHGSSSWYHHHGAGITSNPP